MAFTLRPTLGVGSHWAHFEFLGQFEVQAANTLEDNILAKGINDLRVVCVCI